MTSGLFRVPQEPNLTLNIYAVNPQRGPGEVTVRVNQVNRGGGTGSKESLIDEPLLIPAGEVVTFSVAAPAGEVIEVNNSLAKAPGAGAGSVGARLVTSASIVQFFPADAGLTPQVVLPAGSFVAVSGSGSGQSPATGGSGALPLAPTGSVTSGLLAVPQGVAAARPQVELLLSSFVGWPLTATLSVTEKVEHVATLQPKLQREIRVAANGAAVVPIESVEGRTVKFDLNLPPGLVASLDVYTLFLADNSSVPVFRLGPRDWAVTG